MKHSVPKGDKKRKKETALEIARLEKELNDRQNKELEELSEKDLPVSDFSHHSVCVCVVRLLCVIQFARVILFDNITE